MCLLGHIEALKVLIGRVKIVYSNKGRARERDNCCKTPVSLLDSEELYSISHISHICQIIDYCNVIKQMKKG